MQNQLCGELCSVLCVIWRNPNIWAVTGCLRVKTMNMNIFGQMCDCFQGSARTGPLGTDNECKHD